jgi:hypothetical protein
MIKSYSYSHKYISIERVIISQERTQSEYQALTEEKVDEIGTRPEHFP